MTNKILEGLVADHPIVASHRLPIVRDWWTRYSYFVALIVPDPDGDNTWGLATPSDGEILIAAHYLEYKIESQGFYSHYLKKMREENIVDLDSTFNTVTLGKSENRGWQYEKTTWRHGPWPFDGTKRFDKLVDLLDHIEATFPERWNEYKKAWPEVFGIVE